jgi:hypothetical protein
MQKVNATLNTNGTGYWSEVAKAVEITGMDLGYVSDDKEFGELRVYFNTDTWDVEEHGLIYTDRQFYVELQELIKQHGLTVDLSYSEQGMQGEDYVSLDVGAEFIASWEAKFGYASFADVHVVD